MRVVLALIALLAMASATCIGAGLAAAYASGTGVTPINVPADTVQSVSKLPICAGSAYPKQADGTYQTCCSVDAFNQIKQFGDEFTVALAALDTNNADFQAAKSQLDKATSEICANLPTACDGYKQVVAIIKDFLDHFFADYKPCAASYRDYLEGALCAICRPDFFPDIAVQSGSSVTFTWAPTTCSSIATACTPLITDIYNFVTQFFAAFGNIDFGAGTLAPSTTTDFNFLANIPGASTQDKIQNWLCNFQMQGVYTIDFSGIGSIAGDVGTSLSGIPAKRDNVETIRNEHMNRVRNAMRGFSLRQGSSVSNAYNGTYDPVSIGSKQSFIASASTVTISMAAFIIALFGLFLF